MKKYTIRLFSGGKEVMCWKNAWDAEFSYVECCFYSEDNKAVSISGTIVVTEEGKK